MMFDDILDNQIQNKNYKQYNSNNKSNEVKKGNSNLTKFDDKSTTNNNELINPKNLIIEKTTTEKQIDLLND